MGKAMVYYRLTYKLFLLIVISNLNNMLPEQNKQEVRSTRLAEVAAPAFLGGDSMIEPMADKSGKYKVTFYRGENIKPLVFIISKEQGDDLIGARLAILASDIAQDKMISDEAFQSLAPAYVAEEYKKRLRELGVPEEQLPKTTGEMIAMAQRDLIAYRELGKEQIASAAQEVADEILKIAYEVYRGNNFRYNNLPKVFRQQVDFHLASLGALAAQNSGISEETLEAQKMVLKLNLLAQEETRNMILEHIKETVGAGGEAVGAFFGKMFGGAKGASEVAYKNTRDSLTKKRN